MDITKLGNYFEARRALIEGVKWAEKMRQEGFFNWHENDTMPSGLPWAFVACKGTDYEDVTKLKDLIDLSVAFSKVSTECHKYVKGHDQDMVDDGEGGIECSICLEEYYMKELEIKDIHVSGNTVARMGKDQTYCNEPWRIIPDPEGEGEGEGMETNEYSILEQQAMEPGEVDVGRLVLDPSDPCGGFILPEDAHLGE